MQSNLPVFISIGSNLGTKYDNCLRGIEYLNQLETTEVVKISSFYKTDPVDYLDQDWFVNAVLEITTAFDPFKLMMALKEIETKLGQFEKQVRFGPRFLDLDILLYADQVIRTESLIIPHPRMHKRCFVLKPLCDIKPDIIHPVLKVRAVKLLKDIETDCDQKVRLFSEKQMRKKSVI